MRRKVERVSITISMTMTLDQIKALAQTPAGDTQAVTQLLVEVVAKAMEEEDGPKRASVKWNPDYFDAVVEEPLWQKYNAHPFGRILALQELVRDQYGVLDQLAEI